MRMELHLSTITSRAAKVIGAKNLAANTAILASRMYRAAIRRIEPCEGETGKVWWRSPAMGGRGHHRWETVGPPNLTSKEHFCIKYG